MQSVKAMCDASISAQGKIFATQGSRRAFLSLPQCAAENDHLSIRVVQRGLKQRALALALALFETTTTATSGTRC